MRILVLTHRIPYPPHTGDKTRAYHVARHLAEASHDLVYGHCSAIAQYAAGAAPTPVIMDFVDVDSDKWARYGQKRLAPLIEEPALGATHYSWDAATHRLADELATLAPLSIPAPATGQRPATAALR